jgi:hypothetical protein
MTHDDVLFEMPFVLLESLYTAAVACGTACPGRQAGGRGGGSGSGSRRAAGSTGSWQLALLSSLQCKINGAQRTT